MSRRRLSATALGLLAKCPKAYEYRYVYGIKTPPAAVMVRGTGAHGGIEATLKAKLAGFGLCSDEEVADAARDATVKAWDADPPKLEGDEVAEGPEKTRAAAVDFAVRAAKLFNKELAPKLDVVAVEQEFSVDVPGLPVLFGYKDVVTRTGLRDTKTKDKQPKGDEGEPGGTYGIQVSLYEVDARLRGASLAPPTLDFLVVQKTKAQVVSQPCERTEGDLARFLDRVEVADRQISSGVFSPASPGHWACSERWCGYWNRCPVGKGEARVFVDAERLRRRAA